VVIRKSSAFKKLNQFEYDICPQEESDMRQLLQSSTKDQGLQLDGVIFLWGLSSSLKEGDVFPVCQPFLNLCKTIISLDHPKLFVVTRSVMSVGDQDVAVPTTSPLWAMAKCFQNEQPNAVTRCIDLDDSAEISEQQLKEVFSEFLVDDLEVYVAYRQNQRVVPRFVPWKPQNTALSFPKTERFHLNLPASNAISDLR
jgi:hypothetical protein